MRIGFIWILVCLCPVWASAEADLEQLARKGNLAAQCELGNQLLRGRGVSTDEVRGLALVRRSAQRGYAECQLYLGSMHRDGMWVKQDAGLAENWMRKAAKQGLAQAQVEMGLIALQKPVPDEKSARTWFGKAAVQQAPIAMYQLGRLELAAKNWQQGMLWLFRSSRLGNYDAQRLYDETLPTLSAGQLEVLRQQEGKQP